VANAPKGPRPKPAEKKLDEILEHSGQEALNVAHGTAAGRSSENTQVERTGRSDLWIRPHRQRRYRRCQHRRERERGRDGFQRLKIFHFTDNSRTKAKGHPSRGALSD